MKGNVAKTKGDGGGIDFSQLTDFQYFSYQNNRNALVAKLKYSDTSNANNFRCAFQYCDELTSCPAIDIRNSKQCSHMFDGCKNLISIPEMTLNGSGECMFYMCESLENIPLSSDSKPTSMYQICYGCSKITTFPDIDTSKSTSFCQAFYKCSSLISIPKLNMSSINCTSNYMSYAADMFYGCTELQNVTFEGTFKIGYDVSLFNQSPKVTVESIMSLINAIKRYVTSKTYTITIGSTNLAKLTAEQIAVATDKGFKLQ